VQNHKVSYQDQLEKYQRMAQSYQEQVDKFEKIIIRDGVVIKDLE
jgi:hypothetical protein